MHGANRLSLPTQFGAMTTSKPSFFTKLYRKFFRNSVDGEIFLIFAHIQGESHFSRYPFSTNEEMLALTTQNDVRLLLDYVLENADKLPTAYRDAFLYIMNREVHRELRKYAQHMQWYLRPAERNKALMA